MWLIILKEYVICYNCVKINYNAKRYNWYKWEEVIGNMGGVVVGCGCGCGGGWVRGCMSHDGKITCS